MLSVDVPIEIDAEFTSLPEGRLGSAGSPWWSINRVANVAAPSGLVNQFIGSDSRPNDADIVIVLSKSYGVCTLGSMAIRARRRTTSFPSFCTRSPTDSGFPTASTWTLSTGWEYGIGNDNIPTIFDSHIWTFTYEEGYRQLTNEDDYRNGSDDLSEAVTGHRLYWRGDATGRANSGSGWPILLWAPPSYSQGTSISHVDEDAFPPGDPDSLMVPRHYRGRSYPYPVPSSRPCSLTWVGGCGGSRCT